MLRRCTLRAFAKAAPPTPTPPGPVSSDMAASAAAVALWLKTPQLRDSFLHPTTPHILYQMSMCPFCHKVKTLLTLHKIPFTVVEADPTTMAEVPHRTYKKVPQFQVGGGGPLILDSAEIGNALAPVLGLARDADTDKWRQWSGDVLARYLAINFSHAVRSSALFVVQHPDLTPLHKVKYLGAGVFMYVASNRVIAPKLAALGLDTKKPVDGMMAEIGKWGARVKEGKNSFHGGATPGLADTDVFGVLQSFRCHPLYEQIQKRNEVDVASWMARMEEKTAPPQKYN